MSASSKNISENTNQPHIFLDLDGVMADFDSHAVSKGKYTDDGKVKWDELDLEWWRSMPSCEGAKEFYDAVKNMGVVKFLTAPILSTDCFTGKALWVQKFSKQGKFALNDLIICPGSDKYYLAKPNHILIDDREKNVREWIAAGGIGIYHKGDFKETMTALQTSIKQLSVAKTNAPVPKRAGPGM